MKTLGLTIVSLTVMFCLGIVQAQDIQAALFDKTNRMMQEAKDAQADIISPQAYEDAMDAYNEAQEDYRDEEELSEIRENLAEAESKFAEAMKNTEVGGMMFSKVLSARKDAINAEASQFAQESWGEAEVEFKEAAKEFENGDLEDAKALASKASDLYRKSELESIEAHYLSNARSLIEKAEKGRIDRDAPKTLDDAKTLLAKAEKALTENRYDTDEARHLAKEAEYRSLLAMYIAQQAEVLDDNDYETEDFLLMAFNPIEKIGESMDLDVGFNGGTEQPVARIIETINSYQNTMATLEAKLYESQQENENLKEILEEQRKIQEAMAGQLSEEAEKAQQRQEMLQARLVRFAEIDEKFDRIQQMFDEKDAQVFRQQNDVIIRLIGVNFDVGKALIKSDDHALLQQLQEALNIFDNADIIVEGHTDSQGGDDINFELSQARADSVLSYLETHTTIDNNRFETKGFGESKPVANNENASGRAQNRRIDVVIKPIIDDTFVNRE